jgi:hypothetical protein
MLKRAFSVFIATAVISVSRLDRLVAKNCGLYIGILGTLAPILDSPRFSIFMTLEIPAKRLAESLRRIERVSRSGSGVHAPPGLRALDGLHRAARARLEHR